MRLFRRTSKGHSEQSDGADFDIDDNWYGGYYELSIKLGEAEDQRLDAAVAQMWSSAGLGDAFRRSSSEPWTWIPTTVSADAVLDGHVAAVAEIPQLGRCVCAVMVVREEFEHAGVTRVGADWLDLCLPLGALSRIDSRVGGFPFGEVGDSREWRRPIEDWFSRIAFEIYDAVPFEHAVTGNEVSGVELNEAKPGYLGFVYPDEKSGSLTRIPIERW